MNKMYSQLKWCITLVNLHIFNHPCDPWNEPHLIIMHYFLMHCCIRLASILFRFLHLSSSEILVCSFLFLPSFSLPSFCIRIMVAKKWKQPKRPLLDDWIKKVWYIHTIEYYSATRNNEILQFVTTQMDLENIVLGKISQKEKS